MTLLGKIVGAIIGYMMGGLLGLLIGLFLGHIFDRLLPLLLVGALKNALNKHQGNIQRVFFESTFLVMGHIAKADGHVSEEEIQLARQVMQRMNLGEEASREAMTLFSIGKAPDFNLAAQLKPLHLAIHRHRNLCQMFIEIQLAAGYANGVLDPKERSILLKICHSLGFEESDLKRLESMIQAEMHMHQPGRTRGLSLEDAYAILNVSADVSDSEIKRAYRRLTSQHHPDKLQAKGLPKEMMKIAEEKTHEIRTAYERIRQERGFK
jgi:DnaJ like chaperone protein